MRALSPGKSQILSLQIASGVSREIRTAYYPGSETEGEKGSRWASIGVPLSTFPSSRPARDPKTSRSRSGKYSTNGGATNAPSPPGAKTTPRKNSLITSSA